MRELELNFTGKGEVKGFNYEQKMFDGLVYLYEVKYLDRVWYEVFERKENVGMVNLAGRSFDVNCVSYPKSNSFGLWAFTFSCFENAKNCFDRLSTNIKNRVKV